MNIMYDLFKLSSTATQELNETGGMLKHLRTGFYMHCRLGSQQRSLESYTEKYGSWSRIPESANRDKPDTILAFYCIDPFHKQSVIIGLCLE